MHGQNIDSLLQILDEPAPLDTVLIHDYNLTAYELHTKYPDLCERFALKAEEGAQKINFIHGIALAQTNQGLAEWVRFNLTKAMTHFLRAKDLHLSINNELGIAAIEANIGMLYDELEDYDLALSYYKNAINILKKHEKVPKMAGILSNIGVTFRKKSEPDSALKYYFESLELRISNNDQKGISGLYNNIALVYYRHFDQKERALNYYQKAVEIKKVVGDLSGLSRTYLNMGNIYHEGGQLDQGIEYYTKSLALADSSESRKLMADVLKELSDSESKKKNFAKSLKYLNRYYEIQLELEKENKVDEIKKLQLSHDLKVKEDQLKIINKELEIVQAQQELEVQRRNILLILSILIIVLGFVSFKWQRTRIETSKTKNALMNVELENRRLLEEELKKELEFKNRELTSYTINFLRKNQLMEELQSISQNLMGPALKPDRADISKLNLLIRRSHNLDKDWRDFKAYFEGVHPRF